MRTLLLAGVAAVGWGSLAVAAPVTLAFTGNMQPSPISQSGYSISLSSGDFLMNGFGSLYASEAGAVSTLSRIDGGTFDFVSILLEEGDPALDVKFTGQLAGGGVVTDEYTAAGGGNQTVFLPVDFTNLVSVSFAQGYESVNSYAYNQIVVQPDAPSTGVPEPASFALLGLGVAGVAAVRRRRTG